MPAHVADDDLHHVVPIFGCVGAHRAVGLDVGDGDDVVATQSFDTAPSAGECQLFVATQVLPGKDQQRVGEPGAVQGSGGGFIEVCQAQAGHHRAEAGADRFDVETRRGGSCHRLSSFRLAQCCGWEISDAVVALRLPSFAADRLSKTTAAMDVKPGRSKALHPGSHRPHHHFSARRTQLLDEKLICDRCRPGRLETAQSIGRRRSGRGPGHSNPPSDL